MFVSKSVLSFLKLLGPRLMREYQNTNLWCISVVRGQEGGGAVRTEHGAILPAWAGPLE